MVKGKQGDKITSPPKWVWMPAVLLIGIGVAYPWVMLRHSSHNVMTMGQFGDMFGAMNSLISILGFAGVLWSLHIQREQLKASIQDMKENTEASNKLADAANAQADALLKQNEIMLKHIEVAKKQSDIEAQSALLRSMDEKLHNAIDVAGRSSHDPNLKARIQNDNEVKKAYDRSAALVFRMAQLQDDLSK